MSALKKIHRSRESGQSRRVSSAQNGVHEGLDAVVRKHLECDWKQPLHLPTRSAFENVCGLLAPGETGSLVLDSGCGTGQSCEALASRHPGRVVIGIDRSAARLGRNGVSGDPVRCGNIIRVRAELTTFWRLALEAGWRPQANYLLYPNPWPKAGHFKRRWHGHPVFPVLLGLGGELVLRTNWEVYAREFARAVALATASVVDVNPVEAPEPISPFERKYAHSGHALFEVSVPGSGKQTSRNRAA